MRYTLVAVLAAAGMPAAADSGFDARSYVQGGLIIQYDAIDNEGTGVHNGEAAKWKNLGLHGPQFDCTLSERGSWSADGKSFVCAGDGYAALASAYAPAYNTVETCFNRTSGEIMMNANKNYNRYIVFSGANLGFSWVNNNTENLTAPNVAAGVDQQYAATYEGSTAAHIFKEGVRIADEDLTATKFSNLHACNALTIGSRRDNGTEHPWTGSIHAIRLYDRALTDDELLFNANIDKIRYCDTDPATLTWPAGCRYENGQLEFFVKLAVNVTGDGTVAVTGGPAEEGAWMAAGSEIRLTPKPGAGKMSGGFANRPYTSRMDGDDLVITIENPCTDWQVEAYFNEKWVYPLPKEGLVIDLDASRPELMTMDDEGWVSAWRSVVGGVTFTNGAAAKQPFYEASGADGRGVVWFNCAKDKATKVANWLTADARTTTRTVIMVFNMYTFTTGGTLYMWGGDGSFPCGGGLQLNYGITVRGFYNKDILNGAVSYLNAVPQTVDADTNRQLTILNTGNAGLDKDLFFEVEATDSYFANFCRDRPLYFGMKSDAQSRMVQLKEFIVYDCKLSADEHAFINRTLREKWGTPDDTANQCTFPASLRNRVKVWTNASGDGDWGNGANWLGGIPASNEVAVVENEEVKVKTTASFTRDLKFLEGASLDIAGGTVRLEEGSAIDLPAETKIGTGSTFQGGGTVRFGGDVEADALTACRSTFDLNGHDLTVRSLAGGIVTNSSADASTLTVAPTDDAPGYLNAHVRAGVAVARGGSAEQACAFAGRIDSSDGMAFGTGLTRVVTNECPVLEGCTMHLDATATDTFVFGDRFKQAGCSGTNDIVEWHSLHDPTWMVKTNAQGQLNAAYRPWYDPQAFDGRGGVRFKVDPIGGTNAHTRLFGPRTVVRTCFFVLKQTEGGKGTGPLLHTAKKEDAVIYDNGWSDNSYSWLTFNCDGGDAWINGEKMYDAFASATTGVIYTNADIVATWPKENFANRGRLGMYRAASMSRSAGYTVKPAFGDVELIGVRRKNSAFTCDVCVGDLSFYDNEVNHENCRHVFPGWIGEMIAYDRVLTDDEFFRVQRYLHDKWMPPPRAVPPSASDTLSTGPAAFAAGVALDLGGTTQAVAKAMVAGDAEVTSGALVPQAVETVVAADGSFGALTLDLGLDLTAIDFAFVGEGTPQPGNKTILSVKEQVVGPFKSVAAPRPDQVGYRAHKVIYGFPGLLLFVR